MRTSLVAGNWKMNMTVAQSAALVEALIGGISAKNSVDVVVCPPFLSLPRVREILKNTSIKVGAQNVFWEESGAFTGQISPAMLNDLCIDYCIVGHSETRGRFGKLDIPESTVGFFAETDETVNLKTKALLFHGVTPILCVGETLAEREANHTETVIQQQLQGALAGIDQTEMYGVVIAYEPVWAIGTGKTCESTEANRVCALIREEIAKLAGQEVADEVRILYGGSVKASNAAELFAQSDIDGGLVGGASLEADGFARIVLSAS